ncbi:hypothetical protein CKO15_08035 [Halorhodospira abdelmalekii]|uniref:GGDEF domain-containing protein n=1 Tax=Halorhodospira abdelmalekii TaxID=421629 RepID=UPI001908C11A|nr:GGDEF domain-containing protein [Halorhodospira abdelmalekii]MBK1735234.1 hypothetical protein [Halorhodospira abdelmalekii]
MGMTGARFALQSSVTAAAPGAGGGRLPWYALYAVGVLTLLYFSLDSHQQRYLVLDAGLIGLLGLAAFCLVWRSEGFERLIYGVTALFFMVMVVAFSYRWGLAATGMIGGDDRTNPATAWIVFLFIPWTLGWTYGLALAANLRAQCRVEHMAQHDYLTGLPNRRYLSETMERMAARCACRRGRSESDSGAGFGVVIVDVNGFKEINDRYGHAFGDAALVKLAGLLVNGVRPEDEVVRLGGDEFVLLLRGLSDREALDRLCDRVFEELEEPVQVRGHRVYFVVSLGAAFCPDDGIETDRLLALADQRMYANKSLKGADSEVWRDDDCRGQEQRSAGGCLSPAGDRVV